MSQQKDISSFGPRRVRLSREELLAGKCMPDYSGGDERFKSPDDRLFTSKQQPAPAAASVDNENEIAEIHKNHEIEIARWKEYERQVNKWKDQVVGIVNKMQAENKDVNEVRTELEHCKQLLSDKDHEIASLRSLLQESVTQNKRLLDSHFK